MKKFHKRIGMSTMLITAFVFCGSLTACGDFPAVFTSRPKGGDIVLKDLNGDAEGTMGFSFEDGVMRVELESGTVDVTLVDIIPPIEDTDIPIELDSFYEGTGLQDGDEITYTDSDGEFIVRITGQDATGTITFSAE